MTAVGLWHSTDDTVDATDTPLPTRTGLDATTLPPSSLRLDNVGFVVPDSTGFLFVTIALNLDIDGEVQAAVNDPSAVRLPERERVGAFWQDVTADWTLDSGARTFTGTPDLSGACGLRVTPSATRFPGAGLDRGAAGRARRAGR